MLTEIQFVSDAEGNPVGVLVPIDLWPEIASEQETAYLLKSDTMRQRLLDAKNRTEGVSLEDARAQVGI
jgi:PHD/YefM family antitoxin component YafN of YafNO toxin-antitoxin module